MTGLVFIQGQKRKGARWYTFGPTYAAVPRLRPSKLQGLTPDAAAALLPVTKFNHPTWNFRMIPTTPEAPNG